MLLLTFNKIFIYFEKSGKVQLKNYYLAYENY